MASDEDIAASLPTPPPPAPARRDVAIDMAMRRFDGVDAATPATAPKPARWWATRTRAQIGALVTASLVALIGAPVVWRASEPHSGTVSEQPVARANSTVAAPNELALNDAPQTPPAFAPKPPPTPAPREPTESEPTDPAADEAPKAEKSAAPPPPATELAQADMADRSDQPSRKASTAPAEMRFRAAAPIPAIVAPPAIVAAPAAPPPPSAYAVRSESDGAGDVIVTATRRAASRPIGRGDWNACTIDDPLQSLTACKHAINPAAPGTRGQADAHLADGLSRAWQGDLDSAIGAFDQAVQIAPKLAPAYLNRALAHARAGDLDQAITDADQAVRLAPHAARGYYVRAQLRLRNGEPDKAKADEARARDLDPDYDSIE